MLKKLLIPLFLLLTFSVYAQTDKEIAYRLLGLPMNLVENELDSLHVYYYEHSDIYDGKVRRKNISIANGDNNVKYYMLRAIFGDKVDKIIVNYRHSSYQDLKDLEALDGYAEKNVGKFSTDVVYVLKNKDISSFATEKFTDPEDAIKYARKSTLPDTRIYLYNDKIYSVGVYHHEDEDYVFFADGKVVAKDKLKEVPFEQE